MIKENLTVVNVSPSSVPHPEFSINATYFFSFYSSLHYLSSAYGIYFSPAPCIGSQACFLLLKVSLFILRVVGLRGGAWMPD